MTLFAELVARGLVQDVTHPQDLEKLLAGEPVTFYTGYDPSGASLHAGTLVQFALMTHLARAGHRPIAVVGGATGMIGDPSGKSEERRLLDRDALARNGAAIRRQIEHFLPGALVLDNAEWTAPMSYLDFLRDVGKHVTVNTMLAKESVRARLEDREQGISYTEFSYMLLQAHDFAVLARTRGCRLQLGGSDQWGNITCGIELTRKLGGPEVYGLVTPLLMTAAGTKFGKTEAGTSVWLDPTLTSPYRFYQFWINTADADVEKYLKMFTFVPLRELAELVREHDADRGRRRAQERLAAEVTAWVHGAEAARAVKAASQVLFGGSLADLPPGALAHLFGEVPSSEVPRAEVDAGLPIVDLLHRVELADSRGAARRLVAQGGVYVNNQRADEHRVVGAADVGPEGVIVLRAGKKSHHLVKVN